MKSAVKALLCAAFAARLAIPQSPAPESTPPKIQGETLNGHSIELPDAAADKITLLVFGFSKQGGEQAGVVREHALRDFASDSRFTCYTISMLEGVPIFMRSMVKSWIRNGTPARLRDNTVIALSGSSAWKKFFPMSDAKVPYMLLLNDTGKVRWSGHGMFGQPPYEVLKQAVNDLETQKH